jgi:flagellar biosynthetic protein FliR
VLQQFLTLNLFGFMLVFTRIGTAFILLPGFSAAFISVRTRLFFALAVSFVVATTLSGSLPGLPNKPLELFIMLAGEAFVGGFLGTLARILMSALQTAGTIFAFVSSMANAFVQDPIVDQQSSLVAGFLGNVGVLLIFATNMHHLMLEGLVDSYTLFVPGQVLAFGDFAETVGRRVMDSFRLGIQLASPFLIVGLTYYIGLGLLGRLMPALPVFFVGLPVQVMIQITVLTMALSGIMMVFLSNFQEGLLVFMAP